MKGLFIGLILGAIAAWCWFQTGGKISITETKTITVIETNWVTKTETRYFNETRWITKTNETWKTNMVEKIVQVAPAAVAPVARKVTEQPKPAQPIQAAQPVVQQVVPVSEKKPASAVAITGGTRTIRPGAKIKMGAHRGMDGKIKR
jgi:hypothetical protein